jgi:quercetin dioxygenase-like cupin family protein
LPEQIEDPHSGQRVVFRRNDPEALEVDLYLRRGAFVREDVHPSQQETFAVVAGTFVLDVDGERRTVGEGFSEVISPRTKHGFDPVASEAQLLVTIHPALELAGYFRDFLTLSRDGRLRIPEKGLPKPILLFAMHMHRYRREIAAPLPDLAPAPCLARARLARPAAWPEALASAEKLLDEPLHHREGRRDHRHHASQRLACGAYRRIKTLSHTATSRSTGGQQRGPRTLENARVDFAQSRGWRIVPEPSRVA